MNSQREDEGHRLRPSHLTRLAQSKTLPHFSLEPMARRIMLVRASNVQRGLWDELYREHGVSPGSGDRSGHFDIDTAITELSETYSGLHHRSGVAPQKYAVLQWIRVDRCIAVPLVSRLDERARVVVGRGRTANLTLRDGSVSKLHAYFEPGEGNRLTLTDPGSSNGTFVNGKRIAHNAPVQVRPGDEVGFGAVQTLLCPIEAFWSAVR